MQLKNTYSRFSIGLFTLFIFLGSATAAPLFRNWDDYSKAVRAVQGDLRTTESALRTVKFCESVIASPEDTEDIRICAKLKLASLLIPGFYSDHMIPGLADLPRGLALVKEVMDETTSNLDRLMCLSLRARALAQQGKAVEGEVALAQLERLAAASPNAEGDLWGWAMARNDVFKAGGKSDAERIVWYLNHAQQEPWSKMGQVCAAYVCFKAVSPKTQESQMERALGLLRQYHPNSENRRVAERAWDKVLKEREQRAREAAEDCARATAQQGRLKKAEAKAGSCGCGSPQPTKQSAASSAGCGCGSPQPATQSAPPGGCGSCGATSATLTKPATVKPGSAAPQSGAKAEESAGGCGCGSPAPAKQAAAPPGGGCGCGSDQPATGTQPAAKPAGSSASSSGCGCGSPAPREAAK